MSEQKTIAVYGAGISGLIAAYFLHKEGFKVSVVDPYDDPKIKTLKVPEGLVERAANSILHNDAVKNLLKDIGLEYELYSDLGKKKYVFTGGKAKRWPLGFVETLKSLGGLLSLAKKKPKGKHKMKPLKGELLKDWGGRTLNSAVLSKLLIPGLQGVYGGDTGELSASLVLKNLFSENRPKSLGSVSFLNGMEDFSIGLKNYLVKNGVSFPKESPVEQIDFKVISTPTHSLPDFISFRTKNLLDKVAYKKVSTMTAFVKEEDRMPFKGFGCVFQNQKEGVLGLILNSDIYDGRAKAGLVSETWIFDGEVIATEEAAEALVENFRVNKFSRKNLIEKTYFKYWEKAFPSYDLKLEEALAKLKENPEVKTLFFANWTGGLGIGSMIQAGSDFSKKVKKKVEERI